MTSVTRRCRGDEVFFTRGLHTLVQNANEDAQCVYSDFVCVRCVLLHRVCQIYERSLTFDTHGSVQRRLFSRNTNQIQLYNRIYYSNNITKLHLVGISTE